MIESRKCIVIFFTSKNCTPCRQITPEFNSQIMIHANSENSVSGVSVDISVARDIAAHYQVTGTPSFIFHVDGKIISQVNGASISELRANMDLMVYTAYPPHKHAKISFNTLRSMGIANPIHFVASSNLVAIENKLNKSLIEPISDIGHIFTWVKLPVDARPNFDDKWHDAIERAFSSLPIHDIFPFLDLCRLAVLEKSFRAVFAKKYLPQLIQMTVDVRQSDVPPIATAMMLSRLVYITYSVL